MDIILFLVIIAISVFLLILIFRKKNNLSHAAEPVSKQIQSEVQKILDKLSDSERLIVIYENAVFLDADELYDDTFDIDVVRPEQWINWFVVKKEDEVFLKGKGNVTLSLGESGDFAGGHIIVYPQYLNLPRCTKVTAFAGHFETVALHYLPY